jgi:AcrR family transcriptional regulator
MGVSHKHVTIVDPEGRGARARTMRLMLETAIGLMQDGQNPSVSDVAEAAGVSRATSYRYFPSQAALVDAVIDVALGPILDWGPHSTDVNERVANLMEVSLQRIGEFEATFRAALKLSLDQWAKRKAGTLGTEVPFNRGHRVGLLQNVVAPLRGIASEQDLDRLAKGLSLIFGIEAFVVLKDIWKMEQDDVEQTINWIAQALISAVVNKETIEREH